MNKTTTDDRDKISAIKAFYRRHIREYMPILSFAVGFVWQSLTLDRIDNLWVNLVLFADIILLGLLIVWENLSRSGKLTSPRLLRFAGWYPFTIQFLLGGLFSCYVIFYFQSTTLTQGPLFILILLILIIINQFFEQRLTFLSTQMVMYFMAAFSFFTFFLPVVLGIMNVTVFIAGGFISLGMAVSLLTYLRLKGTGFGLGSYISILSVILALFIGLNVLYYLNLIPPVPLSVKHGGIYHRVKKENNHYILLYERKKWYNFRDLSEPVIHYQPGDTVFCYVSIFAPMKLEKEIYHEWESYDFINKKWIVQDRIGYKITGGRSGGYRGYTYKYRIFPGRWRIDVLTGDGLLLGRIPFMLEQSKYSRDYNRMIR